MIKYLLPRELVSAPEAGSGDSPYADGLYKAFELARPFLKRAALRSIPISLFGLLPSIFILQVYDRVILRNGTATLFALVAGVIGCLCLELWLRAMRSRDLRNAGATIDHEVAAALIGSMLRRPLRALEARPTTAWIMQFREIGALRGSISGGLIGAVFDVPMALFALVVVGIVALPVLPVVIAFVGVMAFLAWYWADEVRAGKVEETHRARNLDSVLSEICRARETIKTLGYHAPVVQMWRGKYNEWLAESFRKNGELEVARESMTVLLTVFSVLIVSTGAMAITHQMMTVGSLMAVNLLAMKTLSPVAGLVSNWRTLARASESATRLSRVLAEPVERERSGVDLPKPKGKITLKDVGFRFSEDSRPVFHHLDMALGPGGLHVIVGKNGAGKSTFLKLLAGLYAPTEGSVSIDEYDLAQFSRDELVEWVSSLSQEVYWFSGPLIESLRRAAPEQSDEEIIAACKLSGAHEFISRLPSGYQTEVGEDGMGLSTGERRKLALAQLFLKKPPVMLLDEPSNDLDYQSETALLTALGAVAQQRTVIAVTHSLRLVAIATRIYYVGGDGTVMQGPPAEMIPKLYGTPRASSMQSSILGRPTESTQPGSTPQGAVA